MSAYDQRRRDTLEVVPPSDCNFRSALANATHEELSEALHRRAFLGHKTAYAALRAEIHRRQAESGDRSRLPDLADYVAQHQAREASIAAEHAKYAAANPMRQATMRAHGYTPPPFTPSTPSPMPKTSSNTSLTAPQTIDIEPAASAPADPWAKARRFVEAATLFQRASLAAQIMAGVELAALRKEFPETRGGDRKSKDQKPHRAGFDQPTWAKAVEKHLGISPDTASRWMEMAHAAKKRLTKGDLSLGAILEKHPGSLTPAEQELLKTAVHKISDGRTQLEFLLECGVTKAPQGSAAKGGNTRAAAGESDSSDSTTGQPAEPTAPVEGWEPRALHLNRLLIECLGDGWQNECHEAQRRELAGNLLDLHREVSATLKPKAG